MPEYKDVIRVCDTKVNIATALREKMIGFCTDTYEVAVKAPGGTMHYFPANGSNRFTNLYIDDSVIHYGNDGTKISFIGDTINLIANNVETALVEEGEVTLKLGGPELLFENAGSITSVIRPNTESGSNTNILLLLGGHTDTSAAGAYIILSGSDCISPGNLLMGTGTEGMAALYLGKNDNTVRYYIEGGGDADTQISFYGDGTVAFPKQVAVGGTLNLRHGITPNVLASNEIPIYTDGDAIITTKKSGVSYTGLAIKVHNGDYTGIYIGNTGICTFPQITLFDRAVWVKHSTEPTGSASGYGRIWTASDNKLYFKDAGGTNHEIAFA